MSAQDWVDKDFYKVLGVSKDASDKDIKKAFRTLARENHPDQHPGDAAAEARFTEVSEANSVLSNPDSRREYDEIREMVANCGFGYGSRAGENTSAPAIDRPITSVGPPWSRPPNTKTSFEPSVAA